ncbi:hypothetical protein [Bartonella bovis]|nr:hypothetical protein [Bartonella bovis]
MACLLDEVYADEKLVINGIVRQYFLLGTDQIILTGNKETIHVMILFLCV